MPKSLRPGRRSPLPTLVISALLSALFVFGVTAVSLPGTAFASEMKLAACSVNLRTYPSTTARIKTTLKTGMRVTVVAAVRGSAYRATCNGKTYSSRYWYRISGINGKSVRSLYGVTYVYGALYLFKTPTPTAPLAPAAGANTVPATIDATCASNASPALNAWIASRPDGSTLTFPSGSCYRLGGDQGLIIKGRNNLTLVGTGSTLQLRTTGASNFSTGLFVENSDHITFRGFTVDGGNTATGTTGAAAAVNEGMTGAMVRSGSDFVEFDHVTLDRLHGFGILTTDLGGGVWPSDISIHDSTIRGGEMGVAIVAGRRIKVERNAINDTVDTAIDLEPDRTTHGFQDVLIADNDITRYSWGQTLTSWFVAANPADAVVSTAIMDGLIVTGNRVHVGAATADNGNADGLGGLGIRADKANLKRDFVFTNNTTTDNDTRSSTRFVINLANVQNLTVTGNRQPITNGSGFLIDVNTTGTRVVSGNDTSP